MEVEREPDRLALDLADDRLGVAPVAEQRRAESGLAGGHLVRQPLVLGEAADQVEQDGDVVGLCGTDAKAGRERVRRHGAQSRRVTAAGQ